jgi:hypothetical protein
MATSSVCRITSTRVPSSIVKTTYSLHEYWGFCAQSGPSRSSKVLKHKLRNTNFHALSPWLCSKASWFKFRIVLCHIQNISILFLFEHRIFISFQYNRLIYCFSWDFLSFLFCKFHCHFELIALVLILSYCFVEGPFSEASSPKLARFWKSLNLQTLLQARRTLNFITVLTRTRHRHEIWDRR